MTIDELARRSGVTTRNIRAYQSKGILPPPVLAGRTGIYDGEHLARLRVVARLQDRGFSLAAVAQLLEAWEEGQTLRDVLGVDRDTEVVHADDIVRLFPDATPEDLQRAVDLGLLTADGDDADLVVAPALLRAGARLAALGTPVPSLLELLHGLHAHFGDVATTVVALFERHVCDAIAATKGASAPDVVQDAAALLRPVAIELIERAVTEAIDARYRSSPRSR